MHILMVDVSPATHFLDTKALSVGDAPCLQDYAGDGEALLPARNQKLNGG